MSLHSLRWLHDARNNVPLLDHTFTYDANGNLIDRIDGVVDALETTTLAYDDRDRLITAEVANKFGEESIVYDPLDNVRQAVIGPLDLRYHYTARNQLQRIAHANGTSLHDYAWNARGALASRSRPGEPGPHALFRDGFEDGGDVLPHILTDFVHDPANRLRSIAGIATYTYDAHGHRLRTDRNDGTRRTALYTRSGQLLEETDTKTNQRIDLVSVNGSLIAKRIRPLNANTATTVYLHSDARGTPSVESNTLGQTTFRARLTAFGSPYDGQWRDGPGFTGHVTDADSQLSYMQQRYFGALEFRFYAPDPVAATILSDNRYWYANNNPYRFVDPDGRQSLAFAGWSDQQIHTIRDNPAAGATFNGLVADFTPVLGDAKAIGEAIQNPTGPNIAAAVIGLAGPVGDAAAKGIKGLDKVADVTVSASKYPESAAHIREAQAAGQPAILTIDRSNAANNRRQSLSGTSPQSGMDRDEYPPAMFSEGGQGASVRHVTSSDNRGAGACLGAQCRGLSNGDRVRIVVKDE